MAFFRGDATIAATCYHRGDQLKSTTKGKNTAMAMAGNIHLAPFEALCLRYGQCYSAIDKARRLADEQLKAIENLLYDASIDLGDTLSLVVFGSLARREATSGSDVDWTLLVDGPVDAEHVRVADRIREIFTGANLVQPGGTGTFGTLASSHDIVHHIGGLEDTNRNMTRRLLLLMESRAFGDNLVRSRVIRAVLDRYIYWGRGLPARGQPRLRVPRFLLNDVVRYWRTIAVDYAAKKWEQADKKWALRNSKLRVTRKMTFVKGLLLCFDCELFPESLPWSSANKASLSSWEVADRWLASGCEKLVQETPIDLLSRVLNSLNLQDLARELFGAYDEFLSLIDDTSVRDGLEKLSFDDAAPDPYFDLIRNNVGQRFGDGLERLLFTESDDLSHLTKKYGLF